MTMTSNTPGSPWPEPPGGNYCVFPTPFAVRLLDCYFGSGPRHNEPPPAGEDELPQPDPGSLVPEVEEAIIPKPAFTFEPRGYAAKRRDTAKPKPPDPPEATDER